MRGSSVVIACALLSALLSAAIAEGRSYDPEHQASRAKLEDVFLDTFQNSNDIFQSAPVTHVVPSLKTVTLAMAAEKYLIDARLDTFNDGYLSGRRAEQRLALNGYKLSPYVAVSLKKIGLGFSAETGAKNILFRIGNRDNFAQTVDFAQRQFSEMTYKGVGAYFYMIPYGADAITMSVVLGGKNYDVAHKVSPIGTTDEALSGVKKYRYSVAEYELGTSIDFRILKNFSMMPWVDYTYVDIHDPIQQADSVLSSGSGPSTDPEVSRAECLKGDAQMFWRARPRAVVGLDLVVRISGFAVHVGDVLGAIANSDGSDQVSDDSYYISLSLDVKGD